MFTSIAVGMLTNVLSSIIYDVGKKGVERCIYSASKKELIEQLNFNYQNSQYTHQEIKETLDILLENQNLMFTLLSNLLNEFEMKTTVNIYNNKITFNVPISDVFKLQQIYNSTDEMNTQSNMEEYSLVDAISTVPSEEELQTLISNVKKHFVVVTPIKPKSIVFEEWYRVKCGKKAVFFEISRTGYYSISRAEIYKEIKHEPRIYVVDTRDLHNYACYEAIENQSLSDGNNIVIKPNTDKGYIIAVSGTLI
ncbi:MAG: hypothetical protein E7551_10575 [Ruminococcaceae bacterium]|nr:hypothetical protein [Oscillospiraceae bacterium]